MRPNAPLPGPNPPPPPQFAGDAVVTFSEQYVYVSANGKEQSSAVGGASEVNPTGVMLNIFLELS